MVARRTVRPVPIVVGRRAAAGGGIGFTARMEEAGAPVSMPVEAHAITLAPTGAGKLLSGTAVAALQWDGPLIVIDPKGENACVTARYRGEHGDKVHVVDPFGVSGLPSSPFNPLAFLDPGAADLLDEARALAEILLPTRFDNRDVFWRSRAMWLLAVAIHAVVRRKVRARRTLVEVRNLVYAWSGSMKRGEGGKPIDIDASDPDVARVRDVFDLGSIETAGGILHTALEGVGWIQGEPIETSLSGEGIDFADVTEGRPMSVYLVLPPHMLSSHGVLLRMWVWTLFAAILRRRRAPRRPTLFLLDEAAQLGHFPPFVTAVTLLRGYGLQTWSFWQDPSQLTDLYPGVWKTVVNNCRMVQCFGAQSDGAWREMTDLLGMPGVSRQDAGRRMLVRLDGAEFLADRLDYRSEPLLAGRFDPNPFHQAGRGPIARPRPRRRPPPAVQPAPAPKAGTELAPALAAACAGLHGRLLAMTDPTGADRAV